MSRLQIRNSLLLFLAAVIWGCAFAAQSIGMEYIEPFTFTTVRSFIGSLFLLPCIYILGKHKASPPPNKAEDKKELLKAGLLCGIIICIAVNLQQIALISAGVGFIL